MPANSLQARPKEGVVSLLVGAGGIVKVCWREGSLGAGNTMNFAIPLELVEYKSKFVSSCGDAVAKHVVFHEP